MFQNMIETKYVFLSSVHSFTFVSLKTSVASLQITKFHMLIRLQILS